MRVVSASFEMVVELFRKEEGLEDATPHRGRTGLPSGVFRVAQSIEELDKR